MLGKKSVCGLVKQAWRCVNTCWAESDRGGLVKRWSCRGPHYTQQEPYSASSLFYCTQTHTPQNNHRSDNT